MLQILQVTRRFGRRTALDDVSFDAAPGDIVGLLGPNGAGKTTLLRLAACYLQPTAGAIRLNGLDSFRDSLAVRRATGYLPERCPLYDDMTVGEYLRFRARIKGLSFLKARRRSRDLLPHQRQGHRLQHHQCRLRLHHSADCGVSGRRRWG